MVRPRLSPCSTMPLIAKGILDTPRKADVIFGKDDAHEESSILGKDRVWTGITSMVPIKPRWGGNFKRGLCLFAVAQNDGQTKEITGGSHDDTT